MDQDLLFIIHLTFSFYFWKAAKVEEWYWIVNFSGEYQCLIHSWGHDTLVRWFNQSRYFILFLQSKINELTSWMVPSKFLLRNIDFRFSIWCLWNKRLNYHQAGGVQFLHLFPEIELTVPTLERKNGRKYLLPRNKCNGTSLSSHMSRVWCLASLCIHISTTNICAGLIKEFRFAGSALQNLRLSISTHSPLIKSCLKHIRHWLL